MLEIQASPPVLKIPTRLLLVDDRPENLIALEVALKDCDYELVTALSGAEALAQIKRKDFAAVLLDVQMPTMDGFEAAMKIRRGSRNSATPIIFVSAIHRTEEYEQLGYIAGAVDFLFKPINTDILRAKVAVFAELHRRNIENLRQAELLKVAALAEQENKFLKSALYSRDEFLSIASHELRTPITPLNLQMQAFIRMYRDGSINSVPIEKLLRMLETSQDQIDRLARLIDDLVDVSRIKMNKLELRLEMVDLRSLVNEVTMAFTEEILRAQCTVEFEGEDAVTGFWDRFRIEQVVVNLLSNSLKYASGSPITISVKTEGENAVFKIRDLGIGVAAENHERIFERFERAVSAWNYGGLGLGLFIARQIVRLHHGDISIKSALGEGAEFTVLLPLFRDSEDPLSII